MKRYLTWIVAAELLFATGNLHANEVEVEVPGLLTDHTVSSIGHEFYRAFSDKWESEYTGNLTINERPSARWGSWITITVNQDVIFQTFLFPMKRDFEKTVVFAGNDSNLLIVFYVQIMPDDFVMQLHRF